MISSLRGTVIGLGHSHAVLDLGGVGMRVELTTSCASQLVVGNQELLHTQLVVREDSLTLFGFSTTEELEMFSLLTSVSGVGPRSALGILSTVSPARIVEAVRQEDERPFKEVSGIGPKTAKLIVVSLHGKLDGFVALGSSASQDSDSPSAVDNVVQALMTLGWGEHASADAVASAARAGAQTSEKELLRAALVLLQNVPGKR